MYHPGTVTGFFKTPGNFLKRAGQKQVITVDPGNNVTGGPAQSFVDGLALAIVFLTYPISKMVFVFMYDVHTFVLAAAINQDILQVRIVLGDHRLNGFFKIGALLITGRD